MCREEENYRQHGLDGVSGRLRLSGRQGADASVSIRTYSQKSRRPRPDHDGWKPGARLRIDRCGRALRRWLSDHALVVGHGNVAARTSEIRRHICPGRGRTWRGLVSARVFVFRLSRSYWQRWSGNFAQDGSDWLGLDGGDPTSYLQYPTRRAEYRIADQCRAERFASGDLWRTRRQPTRRARG